MVNTLGQEYIGIKYINYPNQVHFKVLLYYNCRKYIVVLYVMKYRCTARQHPVVFPTTGYFGLQTITPRHLHQA